MLKSTGLQRRPTISPERRKKNEERAQFRQNRSGSLMVYVEDEPFEEVIGQVNGRTVSSGDYDEDEDVANLRAMMQRVQRSPSPGLPAMKSGASPSPRPTPRNSLGVPSSTKEESVMQAAKESKLQRRKTSTAASFIKKLKIQKKSSPPLEKEGCKIEVSTWHF